MTKRQSPTWGPGALRGLRRAVAVVAMAALPAAQAADVYWNGGFNDSWHQLFNWDPIGGGPFVTRRVPGDIDNVILATPSSDDVYLYGDTDPVNGIALSNGLSLRTNGFKLTVDNGGAGLVTVAGNDSLLSIERLTGDPTGVSFDTDNVTISGGRMAVVGVATIGGTLDIRGTGTVDTAAGARITANRLVMAPVLPSGGQFTLDGQSVFTSVGTAANSIGAFGSARFDIDEFSSAEFWGPLNIGGIAGDPIMTVQNGSVLVTRDLRIGGSGSATDVLVDLGVNARIVQLSGSTLTVGGSAGSALLRVAYGGHVDTSTGGTTVNDTGWIALHAGATATGGRFTANGDVLVDGGRISGSGGSTFTLTPGRDMTVQDGGRVEIDNHLVLGQNSDLRVENSTFAIDPAAGSTALSVGDGAHNASVIATGPATTFELEGALVIGERSGSGAVQIANGAQAHFRFLDMGFFNGSDTHGMLDVHSGADVSMFGNADVIGSGQNSSAMAIIRGAGTTFVMGSNASFLVGTSGAYGHAETHVEDGAELRLNTGAGSIAVRARGEMHVSNAGVHSAGSGGFTNQGLVTVGPSGLISLSNGGLFDNRGGTLTGTGVVDVNGQMFDNGGGTISPGNSTGILDIVDAAFVSDADSVLDIELGGLDTGQYDRLVVFGTATVDGTLRITLVDGFRPALGDAFDVLAALSLGGEFDSVQCIACAGRSFEVMLGTETLRLTVSAVPVPGALWLLASALLALRGARRGRAAGCTAWWRHRD